MILGMRKIIFVLMFFCLACSAPVFCEEIEVDSEVISVGDEAEYFIIRSGEDAGIEIGDGFLVHRNGKKIAGAQIIEVRPTVSAAEILEIEEDEEIMEGDSVLLVKTTGVERRSRKIASRKEPEHVSTASVVEQIDLVSIDIRKDAKAVFAYAGLVLRESGYYVTSSDRATGIILARKPLELSLIKELFADAVAAIDHNVVISFQINDEGNSSTVTASAFKEHSQKGKFIKTAASRNSKHYNEAAQLLSKIKERSEY